MGMSGDGDVKLARLQATLRRAGDRGPPAAAERCAREVTPLLNGEYRRAEDPEGERWAPLKRSPERPLRGILAGLRVAQERNAVRVEVPHHAARFHQRGTRRMLARRILPGVAALPARWRDRLLPAARGAVLALLRQEKGTG